MTIKGFSKLLVCLLVLSLMAFASMAMAASQQEQDMSQMSGDVPQSQKVFTTGLVKLDQDRMPVLEVEGGKVYKLRGCSNLYNEHDEQVRVTGTRATMDGEEIFIVDDYKVLKSK